MRKAYIISGRDLRIRPRNRPEPGEPTEPEEPDPPEEGGDGEGDGGDAIHPPPPHVWPAPGLFIGPTAHNPVIPVPPEPEEGEGEGEHVKLPPGAVWPKARGPVRGHYVALAYVPHHGWRYIVIDPDAWPNWPKDEEENGEENGGGRPDAAPGASGGSRPTPPPARGKP